MKKLLIFSLMLLSSILVACTPMNSGEFEYVSITHVVTKTIDAETTERVTVVEQFKVNPKIVAVFALEVVDILDYVGLDEVGIELLGLPKQNLPSFLTEYEKDKYPNVGTLFEINKDAMDLLMPDLIIIGGRSAALYDSLKLEYPNADVLDVSNSNPYTLANQKAVFENLGKIFPNVKDKLDEKMNQFESEIIELKTKAQGKDALFLLVNGSALSVFGSGSRYRTLYEDFGFEPSDPDVGVVADHGNTVTVEYVSQVNPSYIFLMDRGVATGSSGSTDQVLNNQLIKETTAGINGNIYLLTPEVWYILPGGITSTEIMISDISAALSD